MTHPSLQLTHHLEVALREVIRLAVHRGFWESPRLFMDALVGAMERVEALAGGLNVSHGLEPRKFPLCPRGRARLVHVAEPPEGEEAFEAFAEYVCAVATGEDVVTLSMLVRAIDDASLERRLARHLDFKQAGVRRVLLAEEEAALG